MKDFRIIIPTFNRPDYFRRIMGYYDSFGERFKVIAADSSSDENKKLNKEIAASVSNLEILYLDKYTSDIPSYYKFADAVEHVQEEYCVFCADDDFVTPNGIKQSVGFLESNPDYVVAHGRYIGFRVINKGGQKQRFTWNFSYPLSSVEFSDPGARLEYHLSNYFVPTFFAVHRTDDLKMINRETIKAEVDPFLFYEILSTMLTIIHGKMKCLDTLYGVRNAEPVINSTWPTLYEAIEAGNFDKEYMPFRDCLATNLSNRTKLDNGTAGELVDRAMSAYLHKYMLKPVVPIPESKKRAALTSLHLPEWVNKVIISLYAFCTAKIRKKLLSLWHRFFIKPAFPFSRYGSDFKKVRSYVMAYADKTDVSNQ